MDSTRMNSETTGANSLRAAAGAQNAPANSGNNRGMPSSGATNDPLPVGQSPSGANHNMDALLKRLMKFKHLEDDNKKLKNLLK